ncbi:MAG TPA: MBL fold metallo-hydrolase [Gaiellaceae bacterium]|nr:MBL fold metallo-hydrolase [Gaiellaceae bacterium]
MAGPERISEHVLWLAPGPPDRPSLCAVLGERRTLMLDAGSSAAHARLLLDGLSTPPSHVALTHSHWDHVFGAAEVGAPVIAHSLTAAALRTLAATDWSDEALDRRVAAGEDSAQHAANVKEELPSPRDVQVAQADLVFEDGLDVELGGATVRIRHVGGDHASDSCAMYVEPDGVLFLGDCLYDSPDGRLTPERVFPLYEAVLGFGAELFVEGHGERVVPRSELEGLAAKLRQAHELVEAGETVPEGADADLAFFVGAFAAGR